MSISNFCKDMEDIKDSNNDNNVENNFEDSIESYSLSIITKWLKSKNIEYKYSQSSALGMYLYKTGIDIKIKDESISIQTHPMVAGWAFAETLIRSDMLSDTRHATPEDLFKFIERLC